jgi:hypothetical protein
MTHPGADEQATGGVRAATDPAADIRAATDPASAIRAVADAAGGASDGHTFARRCGDPRPSERRLDGLYVALPDGPFEGLDIRPWTATTVGVVDIDLRAGTVLDWAALQAALPYGPFRAEPQLDPGPPWFSVAAVPAGVVASDVRPSDSAPAGAPADAAPADAAGAGGLAKTAEADGARSDAARAGSGSVLLLVEVRGELVSAITLRRDPPIA